MTTLTAAQIDEMGTKFFYDNDFVNTAGPASQKVTRKITAISKKSVHVKSTKWGVETHSKSNDMDEVFEVIAITDRK